MCDTNWGDGRAQRDTDLQQVLFQGSLHSPRLHFNWYQTAAILNFYLEHTNWRFDSAAVLFLVRYFYLRGQDHPAWGEEGEAKQHPPRRFNLIS